jgi:hypothetical protein
LGICGYFSRQGVLYAYTKARALYVSYLPTAIPLPKAITGSHDIACGKDGKIRTIILA